MDYIYLINKYIYIPEYNLIINKEIEEFFFKYSNNIKKVIIDNITPSKNRLIKEIKNLNQLTLEVTQDCNLRCKYCIYNENYYYHRNRSNKKMNYEVAKEGIEYIFKIIKGRHKKEFALSFYGGEPNGKGSFELIMNNLEKILKKNKQFYNKKVKFSVVWSLDSPIKKIYNFFAENKIVRKNKVYFTTPIGVNTTYFRNLKYGGKKVKKEYYEILELIISKIKKNRKLIPIDYGLLIEFLLLIKSLRFRKFTSLFGSCIFNDKLYLDAEGQFHICHIINNKFPIGDIRNGLDFNEMQRICKEFILLNKKHCYNCRVRFLCPRCYVTFAKNGKFIIEKTLCKTREKAIIAQLEYYIKIQEKGINLNQMMQ